MTPTRTDKIMESSEIGDKFEAVCIYFDGTESTPYVATLLSYNPDELEDWPDGTWWTSECEDGTQGFARNAYGDAPGTIQENCSRIIRKVTK